MIKTVKRTAQIAVGSLFALTLTSGAAVAEMSEKEMLLELKKIIQQQQEQLSKQAAQIEAMQQKLGGVVASVEQKADKKEVEELAGGSSVITSKFENVDVSLYGQINRGVLFADNGDSSKTYFVDNANSSTRMGFNVAVGVNEDFSVGGKLEYEFRSNMSSAVNSENTDTDHDVNLRHADLFFKSETFGKLSLGQGSMAADGSSHKDLSGTGVITYAAIGDMAGGQLWYDDDTNTLSTRTIGNVFSSLDGGREDRLRYDTPSFHGLVLSTSVAADDKYDIVASYSRKYDSVTVASAVAFQTNDDVDGIYNGSVSLLLNNGFNVTLAAGAEDEDNSTDAEGSFWYAKLGYRASIFEAGKTSFSIDYGEYDDFAADDGEASVYSFGVVQDMSDWGTEFYLGVRLHEYEEGSTDYDDIFAVMSGARVKF